MTRARSATVPRVAIAFLALLALAAAALLGPVAAGASGTHPGARAGAATGTATPLTVRLSRLSPATIPAKGTITLAGSVRNVSAETWTAINVHPFISQVPMTTRDELAAAAATDPASEVGSRLYKIGDFVTIGDLAPGASTRFKITVPVADLGISGAPGVYWIGVHALGGNAAGRDNLADGRARTFIPLLRGTRFSSSMSLVVPLRERVRRDPDGRLLDPVSWSQTLSTQGRLRRIADLLSTPGAGAATLLLDPAVLEAVGSVSAGNPPLSFGTAGSAGTPSGSPSGSATDSPSASTTSRSFQRLDAVDQANADAWLTEVTGLARTDAVLGLSYADPDTAALARRKPAMLARSARLAAGTFGRLGITYTAAVAPPDGWLDENALTAIAPKATVLVSDHSAPRTRTQWLTADDQQLVFTDAQAADGGPGPTPPLDALALRQRLLADAALRALAGSTSTMVVELPPDWDPGAGWQAAHFFAGLQQPWLNLVGLDATPAPGTPTFDAGLGYPASARKLEIDRTSVDTARQLVLTGTALSQLLRTQNTVEHTVSGIALDAVSYHARHDQVVAREQVLATDRTLRQRMNAVQVVGTGFVTLSGGSGTLAVTLVNGLTEPITAGIAATVRSDGVRIQAPRPRRLAPGEHAVLRLTASASAIGVHEVTLTPVTANGTPLGTPLTFSLRTSQVGTVVWIIIVGALALLIVMIGRRVLRGVREHRWRGQ